MSVETFLSDLFHKIGDWLKGAEKELATPIKIAEDVLNGLKSFDGSVIGQTLETAIETWIPASTGLINAFKLQLPIWLQELNWLSAETGKTLDEQWQDALTYLSTIKDADVYASQYNTLKALFIKFFGTNAGSVVNIQQALTLGQPTHDASILTPVS